MPVKREKSIEMRPLAVVTKLYPGRDNKSRSVQIKMKNKFYDRPIQNLHQLELSD